MRCVTHSMSGCMKRRRRLPVLAARGCITFAKRLDVLVRHRLLRQPGGFEGFLALGKHLATNQAASAKGPKVRHQDIKRDAASATPAADPDQREDLVAVVFQLLGLDSKVLEGLVSGPPGSAEGFPAPEPVLGRLCSGEIHSKWVPPPQALAQKSPSPKAS